MLGKLLGTLAAWAGAALCGLGLYKIIEIILTGAGSGNWLMVIAGGILAYLFGLMLVVGIIAFIGLGFVIANS